MSGLTAPATPVSAMFTYLRGIDKDVDARVILAVEAVLIVNGLDVPDALAESCFEVDIVFGGGVALRAVCASLRTWNSRTPSHPAL